MAQSKVSVLTDVPTNVPSIVPARIRNFRYPEPINPVNGPFNAAQGFTTDGRMRPPINLTNLVIGKLPSWCQNVDDWIGRNRRVRLTALAVSWYLVYRKGFKSCFDKKGDIWVRHGQDTIIPVGGTEIVYQFSTYPPKTPYIVKMINHALLLSQADFPANGSLAALSIIATYEGVPIKQLNFTMLPIQLMSGPFGYDKSGVNLKPVNGWMVFRSWFLSYVKEWRLPQVKISQLARLAYRLQLERIWWPNIGRTYSFCRDHGIIHSKISLTDFARVELKKYDIHFTPIDLLKQSSIPVDQLERFVPREQLFGTSNHESTLNIPREITFKAPKDLVRDTNSQMLAVVQSATALMKASKSCANSFIMAENHFSVGLEQYVYSN